MQKTMNSLLFSLLIIGLCGQASASQAPAVEIIDKSESAVGGFFYAQRPDGNHLNLLVTCADNECDQLKAVLRMKVDRDGLPRKSYTKQLNVFGLQEFDTMVDDFKGEMISTLRADRDDKKWTASDPVKNYGMGRAEDHGDSDLLAWGSVPVFYGMLVVDLVKMPFTGVEHKVKEIENSDAPRQMLDFLINPDFEKQGRAMPLELFNDLKLALAGDTRIKWVYSTKIDE